MAHYIHPSYDHARERLTSGTTLLDTAIDKLRTLVASMDAVLDPDATGALAVLPSALSPDGDSGTRTLRRSLRTNGSTRSDRQVGTAPLTLCPPYKRSAQARSASVVGNLASTRSSRRRR